MTKKNPGWKEPKNKINKKGKLVAGRHSDVQPKDCSCTMLKPIEPKTWDEIAKRELEKELNVETREVSYEYCEGLGAIALESISGKANNGESEWIVFPDLETAENVVLSKVREDLKNDPEIFTQSWLENFVIIYDTDRRIIAGEESDDLVDNVYSEVDIIAEAGIESEIEEISDAINATDDIDKLTELEYKKEKIMDKAKEDVRSAKYDKIYDALGDPIQYFVKDQCVFSIKDLLKQSFVSIDIDKAAQDAIDKDGADHFLDSYDGSAVELPSGAIAYGTN